MKRTDLPPSWDERATLTTMLNYARATVHATCENVLEEHARATPLSTSPLVSMSGLVNHLRWVEHHWFEVVFLGGEDEGPLHTEDEPDREMRVAVQEPITELLVKYEARCARYRELVAQYDLHKRAKRPVRDGSYPPLRWILQHLIEETARHNGHLDLLREMADGTIGE